VTPGELIRDKWPEALAALLLPMAQFAWNAVREGSRVHRKRVLRGRIKDLI